VANFSFSTRPKRPLDTKAVEQAKQHCDEHGLNFSSFIVELIKKWQNDHKV